MNIFLIIAIILLIIASVLYFKGNKAISIFFLCIAVLSACKGFIVSFPIYLFK